MSSGRSIGRNGSGKTTWFKTVLGLLPAVSGTVTQAPDLQVAYVAQRMQFDALYPLTVQQLVEMGGLSGWRALLPPSRALRTRVAEALDAVGATALADRTFRSLSEGQKQRVLLARMVTSQAKLVLLDEPTAAMDAVAEVESMALLDDLRKRFGMAILVVSHHLPIAMRLADRALYLDHECQEVVVGTPHEVTHHAAFVECYGGSVAEACRHG